MRQPNAVRSRRRWRWAGALTQGRASYHACDSRTLCARAGGGSGIDLRAQRVGALLTLSSSSRYTFSLFGVVLGLGAASGNQIDSLRNTTEHARLSALCRWAGALTHKKVGGGAIQPAAPSLPFPSLPSLPSPSTAPRSNPVRAACRRTITALCRVCAAQTDSHTMTCTRVPELFGQPPNSRRI